MTYVADTVRAAFGEGMHPVAVRDSPLEDMFLPDPRCAVLIGGFKHRSLLT
jgi:hypothetical protein